MSKDEATDKAFNQDNGTCGCVTDGDSIPQISSTSSSGLHILTLNTNKAGMDGLDTDKINEIIRTASEGSRFYLHKQKRQQELDGKLAQMKEAASSFTEDQIKLATQQMDEMVRELEFERDLRRTIVHVDMDMFYAAVEMRDDPSLRDKPMAVGGPGMLSTSNYVARKYGVRAAMPGFIGKKLCPELVIVPPHFDKYKAVSRQVQEVFAEYDPNFCPMSLDEAYLDITYFLNNNILTLQQESEELDMETAANTVVAEMREKILAKTDLTASAGIAPNTRLAKVCSDMNKPNGQFYLPPDLEYIQNFVATLPIRKVSGIGNVTEQHLNSLGITQCSHLMEKRGLLKLLFSDTSIYTFMSVALGLGHSSLSAWTEKERKSISTETTFRGTSERSTLFKLTEDLCQELADEMKQKDIVGKVFTLKLKTIDFQIKSRAQTLVDFTCDQEILVTIARRLLLHEMNTSVGPLSLRLLGVRMSSLMNAADIGPNRQATLTQMFSKIVQNQVSSSDATIRNESKLNMNRLAVCSYGTNESSVNGKTKSPEKPINRILPKSKRGSHVEIRNMLIDQFLPKFSENSGERKMEQYECSVCNKLVKVKNLTEFNKHLDFCLENNASCDPDVETNIINENSAKLHDPGSNEYKTESNITNNEYKNIQLETGDAELTQSLASKSTISEGSNSKESYQYLCPVCDQRQFSDYDLLNKHVDDCLSKNTINKMKQEMDAQFRNTEGEIKGKSRKIYNSEPFDAAQPCVSIKRKGSSKRKKSEKIKRVCNTLDRYLT